jgi:hypothetical protein
VPFNDACFAEPIQIMVSEGKGYKPHNKDACGAIVKLQTILGTAVGIYGINIGIEIMEGMTIHLYGSHR